MLILASSDGSKVIELRDYAVLSSDSFTRLGFLNEAASDVNLPQTSYNGWHNILRKRALSDDEVEEFRADLSDTPVSVSHMIRGALFARNVKVSISTLVPRSRRYFERLIGAYDGSTSISTYASGQGKLFFEQLSAQSPSIGLSYSLLLSSHSSLTAEVRVEDMEDEGWIRALIEMEERGDRISQLGAIEVGIRIVPKYPEIEPTILRLIKQLRDDDTEGSTSGFKLISALFLLVDGELSRTRLLPDYPPYYRRLASLTQAALIGRQIVNSGTSIEDMEEWAVVNRAGYFNVQSLVDMRLEPYWCPEFAAPEQTRASFLTRIIMAALKYEDNIQGTELHELIIGTESNSLSQHVNIPDSCLPGPLEGGEPLSNPLPDAISEAIEEQLGAEKVGLSSFVGLVNFSSIFSVGEDKSELAARALKLGRYRLADIEDKPQLLAALNGLASVAAVTSSRLLADELRILVRQYRQDVQHTLSVREEMRVCLAAAASRSDPMEWRDFVGACVTELAFGELEGDEIVVLQRHLEYLCHVVPELWASCSKADAALKSLKGY